MEIGNVLSEAWALYRRHLGRFFLTALVVYAVLDLVTALADSAAGDSGAAAAARSDRRRDHRRPRDRYRPPAPRRAGALPADDLVDGGRCHRHRRQVGRRVVWPFARDRPRPRLDGVRA